MSYKVKMVDIEEAKKNRERIVQERAEEGDQIEPVRGKKKRVKKDSPTSRERYYRALEKVAKMKEKNENRPG